MSLDDELLVAHAPRLLAWLRARAAAERQNAGIRHQSVDFDNRMEKSRAFAGRGE